MPTKLVIVPAELLTHLAKLYFQIDLLCDCQKLPPPPLIQAKVVLLSVKLQPPLS